MWATKEISISISLKKEFEIVCWILLKYNEKRMNLWHEFNKSHFQLRTPEDNFA